jgi:hypothetical protein
VRCLDCCLALASDLCELLALFCLAMFGSDLRPWIELVMA